MLGYEGDPNEEMRRRYLDEGGPYGYPGMGTPAPAAASTSPYGPGEIEQNEKPRQGAVDGPKQAAENPYGYPEDLEAWTPPARPRQNFAQNFRGTGGIGTGITRAFGQTAYDKDLRSYEDAVAAREAKESDWKRRYGVAADKETRARQAKNDEENRLERQRDNARMDRYYGAMGSDREADNLRADEEGKRRQADREADNRRADQEHRDRQSDREADNLRLSSSGGGGQKFNSTLWKQANEEMAGELDMATGRSAPTDTAAVMKRYRELVQATGGGGDEGGDMEGSAEPEGQPVEAAAAKKLEGKRVRNKRTKQWGHIRNGKFVPEKAPRR